ncbi:MAG: hypothetical protein DCF25_19180 [Leptolyngbya foveolarum]|uniref:Uncharacterized protein n=1 Tax=Leptolyngbya foveolarum TaxID=47253 RepID=A0A2W4VHB1_9CYAN|nr:MAG: hypothetical protein DCF25_19180 [Leptolyngbya foveolarum]
MATYRTCKSLFTGIAIAASLLLTVGCSHSMPTDEQVQKGAAAKEASTGDQASSATPTNDGKMAMGAEAKGVNTNHDVFHSRSLEVPAGTPVPGLSVEVEEDSVRGWNLYVGTANFTFEPSKVNGESLPTEGYAHLYINDQPAQRIYGTWTHLPELPPGTDKLRVTLMANGHETITTQGQPIEESVTVEVYDPNAATN